MIRSLVMAGLATVLACSSTPHRDEVDPRPPRVPIPPSATAHCGDGQDVDAAVCRTAGRIAFAHSRRDTVLEACLHGPYQRLQAIRDAMQDAGPDEGGRIGDVMTEREVLRLEREAEQCSEP